MGERSHAPAGGLARWLALLAMTMVIVSGCAGRSAMATGGTGAGRSVIGMQVFAPAQRHKVPPISGTTLSGAEISLRDLIGHGVVVVNVWASWCESCREESAALAALGRTATNTTFMGIDEQDTGRAARSFVAATRTTYPQLSDPDGTILARLSVLPSYGIPSTLIIDGNGLMAARYIGAVTGPNLHSLITRIAAESRHIPGH